MIRSLTLAAALAAGLVTAAAPVFAHEYKAGSIRIGHPWARATPQGAPVGGGYLTLENQGGEADRLVAVTAPDLAGRVEIHEMRVSDGVMTMRPLAQGLPVPPGGKVELKPGGFHIMFMDLKRPLVAGEMVKGTVTLEKGGTVPVEFKVEAIGAPAAAASGHKH